MLSAELIRPLDADKMKPGDVFYVRTVDDWQRTDCTIHTRSMVAVQVARVARSGKGTELVLRMQPVACAGSETLFLVPLLVAMGARPEIASTALQRMMTAGSEAATITAMFNYGAPPPPHVPENKFETGALYSWGGEVRGEPFKTGEVRGIRHVKLQLPNGSPETTLVSDKSLYLDSGTKLLLTMIVAPEAYRQPARRELVAVKPPERTRPALRMVDPAELCGGSCVEASAGGNGAPGRALWTQSLANAGFMPRLSKDILGLGSGLDDDAAVEFLGEDQVVFAFNTHRLVERSAEDAVDGRRPRFVRAMVFSRSDGRLLKTADWQVGDGDGPYLWSAGGGRILAHVGRELLMLGEGLEAVERFPLGGPLLFVTAAKGQGPLLAATLKERHSSEQHQQLAGFLQRGEVLGEDYQMTALDASLHAIGSETVSKEPLRPALLADAMVTARSDKSGLRWGVQERKWTGEEKRLATLGSSCDLSVSTLAEKLLFVSGCDASDRQRGWYRLMKPDGMTVLKGASGSTDLLQQALSDEAGTRLLIVTSNFEANVYAGLKVSEGDFKQLTVRVVDTKTGKEVFAAHPDGGSAMRQAVALSASGAWVAVIAGTTLSVYPVKD